MKNLKNSFATTDLLGVTFDNLSMGECVERVCELVVTKPFSYIVPLNVDCVMKYLRDHEYQEICRNADLVVPDGVPLLWAAKMLGTPLKGRINGTDLFMKLCELASRKGFSIFLFGANLGVAQKAAMKLSQQFPGIQVAGHYCPPFGFENDPSECRRILDSIAKSEADILFVALGAPKQEKWIWAYGPASGAKIAMAVGGSFSFVTGDLKRAPRLMQKYGFEWLWRLLNEPRRLWRRYLIEDTPFIWIVLKAWLRRRVFRNWTEYSC